MRLAAGAHHELPDAVRQDPLVAVVVAAQHDIRAVLAHHLPERIDQVLRAVAAGAPARVVPVAQQAVAGMRGQVALQPGDLRSSRRCSSRSRSSSSGPRCARRPGRTSTSPRPADRPPRRSSRSSRSRPSVWYSWLPVAGRMRDFIGPQAGSKQLAYSSRRSRTRRPCRPAAQWCPAGGRPGRRRRHRPGCSRSATSPTASRTCGLGRRIRRPACAMWAAGQRRAAWSAAVAGARTAPRRQITTTATSRPTSHATGGAVLRSLGTELGVGAAFRWRAPARPLVARGASCL